MSAAAQASTPEPTRRDFLTLASLTFASVGCAAGLWPLLDSMGPSAATRAEATTEVNVGAIQPGQMVTVRWRGRAVFVVHRTPEQMAAAAGDDRAATLLDPARDRDRVQNPEWLVVVGVCTHLGCTPTSRAVGSLVPRYGGWVCPCHYSQYDISGRVRRGPAPRNLEVPPYKFERADKLVIG
jgi:ubiquinol-cytochrome c reductase iron-sulfur subunit